MSSQIKVDVLSKHELKVTFPGTTTIGSQSVTAEHLYHALTDALVPVPFATEAAGVCVIKG
ncbi:hypothetical protein [Bacillus mycoides]|uniref:Uncharacterized protein n=1 Tax=Bacillus mycoides TaxID=1405 RepID=A0A4U2ZX98_BACMY|nr:hypothetical protein [Bacillus mycoides]TKI79834.1 hypothetical protein FC701_30550 [Bacillus mycoides]